MESPFLSIVIPAYNEQARIIGTLEGMLNYLRERQYSWEVLVVDDGSTDDTAALARAWAGTHPGVRIESVPHGGKGWAVRHGMLAATGRYRFTCDADLAMPVEQLAAFLKRMDEGYELVIGSRQIEGARRFHEPVLRHLMGRGFNWVVRLLAVRGFQDTQCGSKCFSGALADRLFPQQRARGFGFDVEILYLAAKSGARVLEIPIDWYHQPDSKVRVGLDPVMMLRDTILVRLNDLRGVYRESADPQQQRSVREDALLPAPVEGQVVVVSPTYDEAQNLPELADRIFALDIPDMRLIVVDDGSPDGTAQVARDLAERFDGRLQVIERDGKQGLGTAYLEGFSTALEQGADFVLQMDADLSHAPEYIPHFLSSLGDKDVVVGSRYVAGGGVDASWRLKRRLVSHAGNLGIRLVAGLRVRDATSGFKGFRAGALRDLLADEFRCRGFGFQAEVARACQQRGYEVVEHPIVFVDRARGRSKMSIGIVIEALWRLMLVRWRR